MLLTKLVWYCMDRWSQQTSHLIIKSKQTYKTDYKYACQESWENSGKTVRITQLKIVHQPNICHPGESQGSFKNGNVCVKHSGQNIVNNSYGLTKTGIRQSSWEDRNIQTQLANHFVPQVHETHVSIENYKQNNYLSYISKTLEVQHACGTTLANTGLIRVQWGSHPSLTTGIAKAQAKRFFCEIGTNSY